jgi:casein kinase I family protein HRR25
MLFELLGPNIDELFHFCGKKFSLTTVLSLGLQMLNRIETIHSLHIIHRDIKPENFLIGKKDKLSTVYLCDFGLSKRFRDQKTGNHIPYKNNKHFAGTPSFASVYTHLGCEQSRRDDLESLAYILIYLGTGTLPWGGLKSKGKDEKYSKILSKKMNVTKEELLNGLPEEFMDFLQNVRDLQFEEKPDYEYLKGLLRKMNTSDVSLEKVKMDYLSLYEKNTIKNKIDKCEYAKDNYMNNGESKRATKSNSNNDTNINK